MHGVVIIDKPAGSTSFDVVRMVRKACGARKAGHSGTLDPLATGVLPVFVNEATKLMQFFSHDDKEYRATVLLGVETDTLDREGRVIARRECAVTERDVASVLAEMAGPLCQTPPRYSAVKHRGRPLYSWARRGIPVDAAPRTVEIYRIIVEDIRLPLCTFTVACSKGTYIRSLCEEIGKRLSTGACLYDLRRTRCGRFTEQEALALHGYEARERADVIRANLIPITDALHDFKAVPVSAPAAEKIRKGIQPDCGMLDALRMTSLEEGAMITLVTQDHAIVAVAEMLVAARELTSMEKERQAVKIVRVFNT